MPTTFYPALNSIVDLDVLPEQLSFVKDGADDLLSKLFFKDFQYSKSPRGDAAHYSLKLVSLKRIDVSIPGTGFALVLNPSVGAPGDPAQFISEFPITIDWEWPILAYLHAFRTEGFSFDGGAFYDLAVQVFNLPGDRLVEESLAVFFPGPVNAAATLFVDAVNAHPSYDGLPQAVTANPAGEIAASIASVLGVTPARVIFDVFVFDAGDDSVSLDRVAVLFGRVLGENVLDHLKRILIPKIEATLQLSAAIEFPRDVLVPLDAGGNPDSDPAKKSLLVFTTSGASFRFSTEGGFGYSDELEATLTPSQIGSTGLKIEIEKAKLDLSRDRNIAEADLDGRPPDFVGVFITKAAITLPAFLNHDAGGSTAQIYAENLLAGTGGISGTIGLRAKDPLNPAPAVVKASLGGGFELGFSGFDLTFQQNRVTGSNIRGFLKVPAFKDTEGNDALINVTAHIDPNGDFSVVASEEQGIRALRIPNVLDVIVNSVSVGRTNGRFFLAVAGQLDFAEQGAPIGQFVPDKIDVQKLIIWDDGSFEFEGGKLTLPQAISLSIGPVKLSVTAIGFGSHEQEHRGVLRQYKYFTFDGGVGVNPGGVDVSGKGVAFYYTTGNNDLPLADPAARPLDVFMRIQSIAVDIVLPGNAPPKKAAVLIKGFLSMQDATPPATGTDYIGGVDLSLPKLKMAGSAAMRLNPSVPAFIVDAGLEMATPILLGQTGLGIYGFRGLLGMRYVASRQQIGLTDQDPWWQYYKKKVAPDNKEGIQVSKFAQTDGFSLGAGVSLATAFDAGRTFSSKIFFLLSLPEVFLLQGQGQILKQRIGLDTTQDPPFFALISISCVSVEAAFGVNYKIPDEGNRQGAIATLDGVLEMGYYFANSSAWYVNIGKDTPDNRRIQTRLLTVFDVYFYLMLSSSGIRAGAGNKYSLKKKWGPLKAELSAYLDVSGRLSRRPKQIGGSIQLGGTVEVSIFGCGFGLSGDASLVGEGIKPFIIAGSLKVCVRILWKKYCGKFDFNWTFDPSLNLDEILVMAADLAQAGKALNMHTGETFPLWTGTALPPVAALESSMVPMDSFIDLEFAKSVKVAAAVSAKFGGSLQGSKFVEYFPPQRAKSDRVRHEYSLDGVDILYHDGGNWVPYDMYAAATPLALAPFVTTDLSTLPYGYWQNQEPAEQRKLRIMAPSPLNYLSQGTGDVVPEDLGITVETVFCAPERTEEVCYPIDGFRPHVPAPIVLERNRFYFYNFRFRVTGGDGLVVQRPAASFRRAIQAEANESIELYFLEAYAGITLTLAVCSNTADVSYYERVLAPVPKGYKDLPVFMYRLIATKAVPASQGLVEVTYDDVNRPVDKVVISTGTCRKRDPGQCEPHRIFPKLLFAFLQQLIRSEHLTGPDVALSAEFFETYKGVFFETDLYTNPNRPNTRYTVVAIDFAQLRAEITDDDGFRCLLELSVDPEVGGVDWTTVTGITALTPVPASADTRLFTADLTATVEGASRTIRVQGRSCYPMLVCPKPPVHGVDHVGAFLDELVAANRLARPLTTLRGDETRAFGTMIGAAEPPPAVRVVTAVEPGSGAELHAVIDPGGRAETHLAIRPGGSSSGVPFDRIRAFRDPHLVDAGRDRIVLAADAMVQEGAAPALATRPVEIEVTGAWVSGIGVATPELAPAAAGPCGSGCSDQLSPAARELETYLNTLLIRRLMFAPAGAVELFPALDAVFKGVFQGTSLYPGVPPAGRVIRHAVEAVSERSVEFSASDNAGFRAPMTLLKVAGPDNSGIRDLVAISDLRLHPDAPFDQPVFDFLADALFRSGRALVPGAVRGRSPYPLNLCGPKCEVLLYNVCLLRYIDAVENETQGTQEEVTEEVQTMINAFNGSIQPIWRPYTNYAIAIRTQDTLFRENSSTVEQAHAPRTQVFAFRTTGPLGHFHTYIGPGGTPVDRADYAALKLKDRQDEFKLKDFLHYVDFAKCYPNADGQLLNAKPLFYVAPALRLFFLKPYVYEMARSWADLPGSDGTDIAFAVTVKDPAPDPSAPPDAPSEIEWDLSPIPVISTEVKVINNMITYGTPCANVTIIDPLAVYGTVEIPDLRPRKLYTGIFHVSLKRNNAPAGSAVVREVLRYPFQTSRYADFAEQVNSWRLKVNGPVVERAAVFALDVKAAPGMAALAEQSAADTLAGDHPLRRDFGDPFDRLINGVFEIAGLAPAVTTEFNAVRDSFTGRVFGILIRNPEPFNDPKMPDAAIAGTLLASINGSATSAWRVIWSKDRSQAFVTNAANTLDVPPGASAVFTFVYKQWDGSSYAAVTTVVTSAIQLP